MNTATTTGAKQTRANVVKIRVRPHTRGPVQRANRVTATKAANPEGQLLCNGRQPRVVLRLPTLGNRAALKDHRQGHRDLLAAESNQHQISEAGGLATPVAGRSGTAIAREISG
jgi:hypothetical protein